MWLLITPRARLSSLSSVRSTRRACRAGVGWLFITPRSGSNAHRARPAAGWLPTTYDSARWQRLRQGAARLDARGWLLIPLRARLETGGHNLEERDHDLAAREAQPDLLRSRWGLGPNLGRSARGQG